MYRIASLTRCGPAFAENRWTYSSRNLAARLILWYEKSVRQLAKLVLLKVKFRIERHALQVFVCGRLKLALGNPFGNLAAGIQVCFLSRTRR